MLQLVVIGLILIGVGAIVHSIYNKGVEDGHNDSDSTYGDIDNTED